MVDRKTVNVYVAVVVSNVDSTGAGGIGKTNVIYLETKSSKL